MAIINGKDYSEHPKEYLMLLRPLVTQVLPFKSQIIDCQFAKNKTSLYLLIINVERQTYYHLRISNHPSRLNFYQPPTFYIEKFNDQLTLKKGLSTFFSQVTFERFSYHDYFALSVLSFAYRRGVKMYVESNGEFMLEKIPEMIYYCRIKHRWHDLYSPLGQKISEQFRELFPKGQLSYILEKNQEQKIYVTSSGMALLSYFRDKYHQRYLKEVKSVNWHEIEMPVK